MSSTPIRRDRAPRWHAVWLIVLLVAAGCTSVQLVTSYDQAIDEGLTKYYQDMNTFLSQLKRAGKDRPEAKFASHTTFYDQQGAAIDTLVLRAEAAEPKGTCLGSDLVGGLAASLLKFRGFATGTELDIDKIVETLRTKGAGSCTVQILRIVRANHDITAAIHQKNEVLAPAVIDIIRPTIEQGVRIAVTTELAKKRGEK
ncbi:MAG TPA: hypothetical protein VEA38_14895 [Terriglobales bacterium]|nr:hypothetical protein [Terriglobales bacterium]